MWSSAAPERPKPPQEPGDAEKYIMDTKALLLTALQNMPNVSTISVGDLLPTTSKEQTSLATQYDVTQQLPTLRKATVTKW